ncbi:MAG: phenylacetic acid degradation protein [Rhodobacterales bacterium]|nr:MAG: phenylacetic acid degradation protein [Rhodobacterales bacterium]
MKIKPEIAENFARQGLMNTLGAELVSSGEGVAVIAAPIRPEVSQQQGAAHAGLAFSLGDSACGYAALTVLPEGADVVTSEIKINLLTLAVGERLRATGHVVRAGRRLIVVTGEVHAEQADGTDKLVAILQGTMVPV